VMTPPRLGVIWVPMILPVDSPSLFLVTKELFHLLNIDFVVSFRSPFDFTNPLHVMFPVALPSHFVLCLPGWS